MFEYRKHKAIQFSNLMPSLLLRKGLLAIAVTSVVGGCAQIPHGSMFSEERQMQMQASLQPSLSIKKDIDLVRVTGTVGSKVEAAMIRLRVAAIYGAEMVIDDLQIDEGLGAVDWYSAVLDTAERMQAVEEFGLTVERGQLRLDGEMPSRETADALADDAVQTLGEQLTVSNEIDYPGRAEEILAQSAETEETLIAVTLPQPDQPEANQQSEDVQPIVSNETDSPARDGEILSQSEESEGTLIAVTLPQPEQTNANQQSEDVQPIVSNEPDSPARDEEILSQSEESEGTLIAVTLPQPEQTDANQQPEVDQQIETEQQLTAQSIPSPAVSSTIALPVTTSAVVLEQRAVLDDEDGIFVPPVDDGIEQSAKVGTSNDSDGDGIVDSIDECNSRAGYPVDARGCQALDGMLKNVRFEGEGNTLTREAMASLDNVARVMNQYPEARIAILSYTSDTGSVLENRGQSRDRARSVVGYLIDKGVQSTRLEAYALGHINNSDDHIMIKEVD